MVSLIEQSLKRIETVGGLFYEEFDTGIALSSPLSPLLAAIALIPLDKTFAKNTQIYYRRFVDDYIVLTKSHGQLRKAVKKMWQVLHEINLTIAVAKTYIGKISNGFNFLGYSFEPNLFTVANQTLLKHLMKKCRLYEQGSSTKEIAAYQKRFDTWCSAGVRLMCYLNPNHLAHTPPHWLPRNA